jgi:Domain of unknown function (DUF4397)
MVRSLLLVVGVALLAAGVAPAQAQMGTAQVRVLHGAPDTAPVDVLVNGQAVVSDLAFAAASEYLELPAGRHELRLVSAAGEGSEVLATTITIEVGQFYTIAAIGLNDISAQLYRDDRSPIPEGQARLRVIHTSPDAPGVDVEVVGGSTLVEDVGFAEASPYLTVAAGSYNLQVVATGTNAVFLPLPNVDLRAGAVYDVYAVGRLANLQAQILTAPALTGAPQQMPVTGTADVAALRSMLGLLGLLLIASGVSMRRYARRRA